MECEGMPLNSYRRQAINKLNLLVYTGKIEIEKVNHCFCGNEDFELLSGFDRYGLPFGTQICQNCGLISQTIQLKESSLGLFYDEIYWPLIYGDMKSSSFSTQLSGSSDFLAFLKDDINFNADTINIHEIGCGQGDRIVQLGNALKPRYNVKLYGCDFSSGALEIASKRGIYTVQGGIEQLLGKGPADILILSHIVEHFVNLKESLELIDRLTHNDSLIYVEVPGVIDLKNKREYMFDYQTYTVLAHIHNFSLATLANVFASQGLKLVKGSEYVRMILKKNVEKPQEVSSNPYIEIIDALRDARQKHLKLKKKLTNPLRKYLKSLIKAILGRLD